MVEPLDWMSYLTDKEKLYLERDYDNAVDASEDVRKFACTVAASRALVAEKDKALRNYGVHMTGDCLGLRRECICSFSAALALTEEDMREWLEVK